MPGPRKLTTATPLLERDLEHLLDVEGEEGLLWPDPVTGPWYLVAHWAEVAGYPECIGIEVWRGSVPAPRENRSFLRLKGQELKGLRSGDLKGIPVATVLSELWQVQRKQEEQRRVRVEAVIAEAEAVEADTRQLALLHELGERLPSVEKFQGPRRRNRNDARHFEQVSIVYKHAVLNRQHPTQAVQEHFIVSHSTAAKWVNRARELGLLPPTTPGRPSAPIGLALAESRRSKRKAGS